MFLEVWESFPCLERFMRILSEGGSDCIGNPIQIQKHENIGSLPENGPFFTFRSELDLDERHLF